MWKKVSEITFWWSYIKAQASGIRIESCLPILNAGLEPGSIKTPIRQQTEYPLTNRLSYRGSSYKTWTQQPVPMMSEHSAHLTLLPLGFRISLWRYTCCCQCRCSGTGKRYSNRKETSCLPLLSLNAGLEPGSLKTPIRQHTECPLTNRLSYRGSTLVIWDWAMHTYRIIFLYKNIRRTKSQNVHVSRLTLRLLLPNPKRPVVNRFQYKKPRAPCGSV